MLLCFWIFNRLLNIPWYINQINGSFYRKVQSKKWYRMTTKMPTKIILSCAGGRADPLCASWYVRWFLNLEAKSADVVSNDGHKVVTNLLRPSAQCVLIFFEVAFSFIFFTHSSRQKCNWKISKAYQNWIKMGSVAGPVIQANGRLTFEDDLRSGGLLYFTTQWTSVRTELTDSMVNLGEPGGG